MLRIGPVTVGAGEAQAILIKPTDLMQKALQPISREEKHYCPRPGLSDIRQANHGRFGNLPPTFPQ
jgi:hypothetical protein